ncbi:MAG: hypothetical protein ACM3NW_02400 [Syntrophomonadaceae bacterium]
MSGPVLALVPPPTPGIPPQTPLLGLPLARRTVLAARRAGFSRVVVAGADASRAAALEGAGADLVGDAPPGAVR